MRRKRGVVLIELIVAAGLLALVGGGFAAAQFTDARVLRAQYARAVAIEIVDGEMEVLLAGEWKAFGEGTHDYPIRGDAARNLPAGKLSLTVRGKTVRLEWTPIKPHQVGRVVREVIVP